MAPTTGGGRQREDPLRNDQSLLSFRGYLELREKRSYVKVALQAGVSRTYVERIAKRWKWTERTRAFDSHVSDAETAAFIQERRSMARRQAQIGVLGQNIATASLWPSRSNCKPRARSASSKCTRSRGFWT